MASYTIGVARMATQVALPQPNVDYSLALGSSFAPEAGEEVGTSYAALRYDFRPASADIEQPGVLVLGKDNRVSLYLANSATCELDVLLSGKYEPYAGGGPPTSTTQGRDCLDCVALFDPVTGAFRLEALLGQYNTKHVRDAPPYRPPSDDLVDLSPGTSGSAGPGLSMSPPGTQPARRSYSPRGSDDGGLQGGQMQHQSLAGQGHDRIATTAAAAARSSKPPRPPSTGPSGRSAGGSAGAQGKKRQRDGGAAAAGPSGSPLGAPAKQTSRLARASGPRAQEQGQTKRGGVKQAAAGKEWQKNHGSAAATTAEATGIAQPGAGGEDEDFDAELLDAFDTFDSFDMGHEEAAAAAAPAAMATAVESMGGGDAALGNRGGAAAADPSAVAAGITAATEPGACGAEPTALGNASLAQAPAVHNNPPAPTLEDDDVVEGLPVVEEDEEFHHEQQQPQQPEPEAAPPSPPRARLVVEMMDDDDGFGYAGEEEDGMGLGIEYF